MAAIGPVLLDIQKVPDNLGADVEVRYTVRFDDSDVRTNRAYTETIELIGVDDGPLNTRDEVIRTVFSNAVRADARTSADIARGPARVQRRELNEDKPGRDEIRARVTLRSGSRVVSRESNLVIDDFNPAHA